MEMINHVLKHDTRFDGCDRISECIANRYRSRWAQPPTGALSPISYESEGRTFESFRARQLSLVRSGHMGYDLYRRHR